MKKLYLILPVVFALTLSSCGNLENEIREKSEINNDENYIKYQNYINEGNVDQEGYYQENIIDGTAGKVHITFASNNNLNVKYYTDAAHKNQIETQSYYADLGASIYAEVENSNDIYSSAYEFSGFEVYRYEDSQTRETAENLKGDYLKDGAVLHIPDDYDGADISIEPIGAYRQKVISLKDYCSDDDATYSLNGKWLIDDKECAGGETEVNPISPHIISYEYDNDEYFFIASEPECYYSNNNDGVVIFNQLEAADKTTDYSIELHKYITVTLVSDKQRTVKVNGGDNQSINANAELSIPHLKYGDVVTIETDKAWEDLETKRELILTKTIPISSGGYRYTLTVPQKDGKFEFNPSEYKYEHGEIIFKCFGDVVTDTQHLAKGSKIYYEQGKADDGYWLASGEHCIIVGEESETKRQLQNIHFTPKVDVVVKLPQPSFGGRIVYYADGVKVDGESYRTNAGTVISMDFITWEGWKLNSELNVYDNAEYIVSENTSQTVISGADVDRVFEEDEGHKPELTVVLEKSVGKDMQFDISASGIEQKDYKYEDKWYRNDYTLIKSKIGAEQGIVISMKNRAIQSGKAVKISIEKADKDSKNIEKELRYINDLTKLQEPIYIYSDDADSNIWYKNVNITISVVDVNTFTETKPAQHSTLTVKNADTKEILKAGDFIEKGQKVIVTISPEKGYYVSGKKTSNDVYSQTMKYSEYVSDINGIIEKHPIKKILEITLDKSDSYASYKYKLEGTEVSDTVIEAREGQELAIEYEIISSGYKLDKSYGGFLKIGASNKKAQSSIKITPDMDGKTIKKEDFGINAVEE